MDDGFQFQPKTSIKEILSGLKITSCPTTLALRLGHRCGRADMQGVCLLPDLHLTFILSGKTSLLIVMIM